MSLADDETHLKLIMGIQELVVIKLVLALDSTDMTGSQDKVDEKVGLKVNSVSVGERSEAIWGIILNQTEKERCYEVNDMNMLQ